MSWIDALKSTISISDIIVISFVSAILFLLANFVFTYLSPSLMPHLPADFVRSISPCYRSLYHFDLSHVSADTRIEVVFGDSFSEGAGDEYLNGEDDYGIFRKLPVDHERGTVVYGRAGYGSLSTLREAVHCEPLINGYTSLGFEKSQVDRVTLVFYEGNDFNNNLAELTRTGGPSRSSFRFFLPIAEYAYDKIALLFGSERTDPVRVDTPGQQSDEDRGAADFLKTAHGVAVRKYPQSAALELTEEELAEAVGVLRNSLNEIGRLYPDAALQLLYLPSVASSYEFEGALPVQSYQGEKFYLSSGAANDERSRQLRETLEQVAGEAGWDFCDSTGRIREISRTGVAVHGPVDWKHFNEVGYQSISESYLACFPLSRP